MRKAFVFLQTGNWKRQDRAYIRASEHTHLPYHLLHPSFTMLQAGLHFLFFVKIKEQNKYQCFSRTRQKCEKKGDFILESG